MPARHLTAKGQERRQRRAMRRRKQILAAAAQVFAQKGYSSTTTKEIADAADVAEGTLYNYFSSKHEILLCIATEAETPMESALQEAGKLENREAMIALFEEAFHITEARLPFLRALLAEAWTDDSLLKEFVAARLRRIYEMLQVFISERVASGAFRPIDPGIGARMAMGTFGGLILPALRGVEPLPSPDERHALAEMLVDMLLDGIRVRQD